MNLKNDKSILGKVSREFLTMHSSNQARTRYHYLQVCPTSESPHLQAGINDLTFQAGTYLLLAKELGLTFILPRAKLEGIHNNNRYEELVWSDYYDLDNVCVAGEKVNVVENTFHYFEGQSNFRKRSSMSYLKSKALYQYYEWKGILKIEALKRRYGETPNDSFDPFAEICRSFDANSYFPPSHEDLTLANRILRQYSFEGCVHIRRTDRCTVGSSAHGVTGEEWDLGTQPKNILTFLKLTDAPTNLYVMTDMDSNDKHVQELKNNVNFNMIFMHEIPELAQIKERSNYKLFNIEKCIYKAVRYQRSSLQMARFYKGEIPWLNKKLRLLK